ncbi:MAG: hypothetical protein R6U95_08000 [Bacteroidales bacterium]
MNMKILTMTIISAFIFLTSCGGGDVVDSGTYTGVIKKVEPAKSEIYVTTDNKKELELYFTNVTTITKNGEEVEFPELSKGQKVEVEIEKIGKRLDPISVKILE